MNINTRFLALGALVLMSGSMPMAHAAEVTASEPPVAQDFLQEFVALGKAPANRVDAPAETRKSESAANQAQASTPSPVATEDLVAEADQATDPAPQETPGRWERMRESFAKVFRRSPDREPIPEQTPAEVQPAKVADTPAPKLDKATVKTADAREAPTSDAPEPPVAEKEIPKIEETARIAAVPREAEAKKVDAKKAEANSEPESVAEAPVAEKPGPIRRMMDSIKGLASGKSDDESLPSDIGNGEYVLDGAMDSPVSFNEMHSGAAQITVSKLELADYLRLVALNNDRIAYQRLEWAIARSGVDSAEGMYEPALTATYRYTDSNTPNTTEEEFRRSFSPEFIEQNTDYSIGVEGMVPTGGKVKLSYSNRDLDNNIQPTPIRGEENKSYLGLSFTQPLLRGAGGPDVVNAPITVATKEQAIALQTYRLALFESVSGAAVAYWDLFLAEKKLNLRRRSVEIAESVLNDERESNRFGRSSNIEVLSAESAVAQRRVQFYSAQQEVLQAKNRLKGFVAGMDKQADLGINLDSKPGNPVGKPQKDMILANAFNNRPEYLASLIRAEKEEVRMAFARNNRLPQLDLVASYGLNGLDDSFSSSWDNLNEGDHKTMYVGLEYKMFLLGNKKAKSELVAATLRKHQALLEVQAAEVTIHNSVDTALNNLLTALMQVEELNNVTATNERLLAVELARFEAGQSSSRDILDLEERINQTSEIALQSQANMQKAVVGIALADGTLLKQYKLER